MHEDGPLFYCAQHRGDAGRGRPVFGQPTQVRAIIMCWVPGRFTMVASDMMQCVPR